MNDILMVIIVIGVSVAVIVVLPLMTMAERTDDMAQATVEATLTEALDSYAQKGEITVEDYEKLQQTIDSTGVPCELELIIGLLDENIGKKVTQAISDKLGEDVYVYIYTTQLENDYLYSGEGKIKLWEGCTIKASVKSKAPSLANKMTGSEDIPSISYEKSVMVRTNGK